MPFKSDSARLYLHRHTSFKVSGLYEKRAASAVKMSNASQPQLPDEAAEAVEAVEAAMAESPMTLISDRGIDLDKVNFLPDGEDPYGFISIDVLLQLTRFG